MKNSNIESTFGLDSFTKLINGSAIGGHRKRKIDCVKLMHTICQETIKSSPSFRNLAEAYFFNHGTIVSKQAIAKKFNDDMLTLFKSILSNLFSKFLKLPKIDYSGKLKSIFNRILLQDSTVVKLPDSADESFIGMKNQNKNSKGCRIQAVFDILSNNFADFEITPYTVNDQKAASRTKSFLQRRDLIIRDLGYLTMDGLSRIIELKAFFISKIKTTTNFYDQDGNKVNLLNLFGKSKLVDCHLLMSKKKIPVRLVARPVPQNIANERIRKKKKDSRNNPSKDSLKLCGWDIIITNISQNDIEPNIIIELYKLRWKIEIIFKTWKSFFNLKAFHSGISKNQIMIYIIARLITISYINTRIINPLLNIAEKEYNVFLSYQKLTQFIASKLEKIIRYLENKSSTSIRDLLIVIIKNTQYEKRRRINYKQKEAMLLNNLMRDNPKKLKDVRA